MTLKEIQLPQYGTYLYESRHKEGDIIHVHHHTIHQILYAIEGEGKISIDGHEYKITQDQSAFIAPHSQHSIYSQSSLTLLVLAFNIGTLEFFDGNELKNPIFQQSRFVQPDLIASSELRQHLRKMLYEQSSENPFSKWALKIHLLNILLTMTRLGEKTQYQDANSLRIEKIKKYIDTHYYDPLTSKDIAAKLGISSRYINSIFKDYYHKTPIQYLTEVRIERAKELLSETDKEIITICFEVGYETLSTFYRAFKNTMSMSPNQYRNMVMKQSELQPVE
ncbi:helix-turn-helix domain-containing protein [Lederbergia wuyishanensis]|uniref:AraC-like DNA-binding protein n=1 Tax=Lederbergia wuyishanensis TaxID=1347903 RepID=A0ABU0D1R3_9BACI|nr:AraC family transcriptional regulator [Lederbergia wuyishanensis]MCJ8006969.1 AraC family transcriptional regulator [Lederbergia wuyishanensis]MDQ0342353.1 AraC-like DNA-binding protein [Lederbergia wuyishanensis]